ncbi:MAG: hypothetical protein R3E08_13140 [Thiotrichaceae bacterium]
MLQLDMRMFRDRKGVSYTLVKPSTKMPIDSIGYDSAFHPTCPPIVPKINGPLFNPMPTSILGILL